MEQYKFNNISEYLEATGGEREQLMSQIARAAVYLALNCEKNFGGFPSMTEDATMPISHLYDIVENVK